MKNGNMKLKMHGPEEAAFAVEIFSRVGAGMKRLRPVSIFKPNFSMRAIRRSKIFFPCLTKVL